MWTHDDKELDRLSREAAENYSMDRQAGSWDKLLKRLDAELPEKERKRRWVPFLLLFLIVGGGIWFVAGNSKGKPEPQRSAEISKPQNESKLESTEAITK